MRKKLEKKLVERRIKEEVKLKKKKKWVVEVRSAMFSQKEKKSSLYLSTRGCLTSNDNNLSLRSVFQSLLQDVEDVSRDEGPKGLPLLRIFSNKL